MSFIYRGTGAGWHKWETGDAIGAGWHHIALTYTFGDAGSIVGYVDGTAVTGSWTLGAGNAAPLQDNDALWIGSARAGDEKCSFEGGIDEVAIYRTALSGTRIKAHYDAAIVPEPCSVTLLLTGLVCLMLGAAVRRRRKE